LKCAKSKTAAGLMLGIFHQSEHLFNQSKCEIYQTK